MAYLVITNKALHLRKQPIAKLQQGAQWLLRSVGSSYQQVNKRQLHKTALDKVLQQKRHFDKQNI